MNTNSLSALTHEAQTMAERILTRVAFDGSVSFAEMSRIDGFSGDDLEAVIPGTEVVLWAGMSQVGYKAWATLMDAKLIEPAPTTTFVYLIDGAHIQLPVANASYIKRYKKPHWLPVVFNATEAGSRMAKSLKRGDSDV